MELDLSDNSFGSKGSVAFARALANSNYLTSLNISHNKIKGKGLAEILQSLSTNTTLQVLNIAKNAQVLGAHHIQISSNRTYRAPRM